MKRKIYNELIQWKDNVVNIKPIMIMGARQVGKTYIIREFCKKEYNSFIEVNLLNRSDIVNLYNRNDLSSEQKFNYFKTLINYDIEKEDTILFIDEIQESEKLISDLKFFCENYNSVRIICSGSLLGVKLNRFSESFPVGKVKMINMYPMDFEEFLWALGREDLINEIKISYISNKSMVEELHNLCLEYYRFYLICGGMPESVYNFISNGCDIVKYDSLIKGNIIESYIKDMKKYVKNESETLKIEKMYKSVPIQILNKSHKFQLSKIDKSFRSRELELPLDWLIESNLVLTSFKVNMPSIPLKGYVDESTFKLFINDIGLLNYMLEIRHSDIISDNMSLFKGSIIENYVACALTYNGVSLYYWLSSGKAEIDFLLYNEDGIIPIEVKASDNTKSKSLNMYVNKYKPKYAIRISTKNFGYNKENNIKYIPLYAVFCIK